MDYEGRITGMAGTERLGWLSARCAAARGGPRRILPRGRASETESAGKGTSVATVLAVRSALGYAVDSCPVPTKGGLAAYAEPLAGP